MKRLLFCAALAAICACGPDWKGPGPDCFTDRCASCPDGTTPSGDKCLLPATCPAETSMVDGRCLLAPYCPVALTSGRCLIPPECPVPLVEGECQERSICPSDTVPSGGLCLLEPSCPEGTTLVGTDCYLDPMCPEGSSMVDGTCYLPVICPEGTVRHGSSCYEPVVCQSPNKAYDYERGECRKVCHNHQNQNPATCPNGWFSNDENSGEHACSCPPPECQNPHASALARSTACVTPPYQCTPERIGEVVP